MKFKLVALSLGLFIAGSLNAQTMTDVINEFNSGVELLNNQEYDDAIGHFNQVLVMADQVGEEANDMKANAQKQIPAAYYRNASVFMKRKQYDNAIPLLEKTIETATLYANNEELKAKSQNYLPALYAREGNKELKNKNYEAALANFDKAIELKPNLYQAEQGKAMVYMAQDEREEMMAAFAKAKAGAKTKGDTKTISSINGAIDTYYNKFIIEEMEMVDPEDNDYSYVIEACENALAANDKNPMAYYHMAMINNKKVEYDFAIENALKALEYESDPIWISAINFELGQAYQNTVEYDKACETFKKVTEEPFLARAEKKIEYIGCN